MLVPLAAYWGGAGGLGGGWMRVASALMSLPAKKLWRWRVAIEHRTVGARFLSLVSLLGV